MKQLTPLIILLCLSCGGEQPSQSVVRPVKSCVAEPTDYLERDFAGMATPLNAVNLAFKISGQVLDVPVSTGESVAQGQLLAELDPRDIELQVSADRSTYEQALSKLNRSKRLLEREAVSRQEYENSLSAFAQAESTYENAKEVLVQTSMTAPFAAVVEAVYIDNYERVQSGQTVIRIVEPYTTTVSFTVPESGLIAIADSTTRYSVRFDNYSDMLFGATLKEFAITTSSASLFPVSLTVDNPSPSKYHISPGFSCTITVKSEEENRGAISLPLSAIYAPTAGGTYVWIIDKDSRVRRRAVVIGALFGVDRVVINSGVKRGERVVSAGVYKLTEGERVKVI